MTDQLTVRIDVENSIAVVAARSWGLALAAAAGSQVLAGTAAASHIPGHEENVTNPIVYPELIYGVVAGLIVGVITGVVTGIVVTRALSSNLKK